MNTRRLAALAIALVAASALVWIVLGKLAPRESMAPSSLSSASAEASSASAKLAAEARGPRLRLGVPRNATAGLAVFANQRLGPLGGIDLELTPFKSSKGALKAMLAGKVDAAVAGDLAVATTSVDRQDLRILASLGESGFDRWIVARLGIRKVEDLRGKAVGVERRAASEYVLDDILGRHGMSESDVRVVDLAEAALGPSLESGVIDAFAIEQPYTGSAQKRVGFEVTEIVDEEGYRARTLLVTRSDDSTAHPAELAKLLAALAEAADAAYADPPAATASIAKDPLFEKTDARDALKALTFEVKLDDALAERLQKEVDWFTKSGKRWGVAPTAVRKLFAPEPLSRARPSSMRLSRP